jgi:hypothetical protein
MTHEHEFRELEQLIRGMQRSAEDLNRSAREQERELTRLREEMAGSDEERAERARRGQMGPDWVRLQQQIDLHQTSIEAIMSGADESREAERVREQSLAGADAIFTQQQDDLEEEDDPAVAAVREQVEEIRALLREIQQMPPPQV